jgi:hypothetical protein
MTRILACLEFGVFSRRRLDRECRGDGERASFSIRMQISGLLVSLRVADARPERGGGFAPPR